MQGNIPVTPWGAILGPLLGFIYENSVMEESDYVLSLKRVSPP